MAEAAHFQGMATSPARRRLRRAAALLAGAPLLAGLLWLPTAPPAEAASGSETVDVALNGLSPSAPVKGDTLTVSGTVTNKGKEAITDAEVDLRVGPRLSGRPHIDEASKTTGYAPGSDAKALGGPYRVTIDRLASGISEDFTLTVPVSKLDLGKAGVYQLGVSLSGRTAGDTHDQVLGIERTFLPWQPESAGKKTQLTFLWPLVSTTHLSAETGSDEQQTPVFENDVLAAELAAGGRLEQLVSLGSRLPITWVIDPDLLATVDAMTRSYEVRTETGDTVPGRNQAVAKRWLNSLEKAVQDRPVVALPFADPDLASLAHRGKDVSGSLRHLQPATAVAETTVETILHVKPSTDFAWPVEGAIDPSIVDVATSAGAHNIIARSDSLRETGSVSYTPSAARPIGGGTTAVVADARLSKAFYGDLSKAGASTRAVQQFLAQSLALTQQAPNAQRSIVVAPQRMPTAGQAQSMAKALQGLAGQRWTQPLDLIGASEATPDPDATTRVPAASQYPKDLKARELPVQTFQDIKTTQETLDNFKVILTSPDRVVTPFGNAINREMSTSWRGKAGVAAQYRNGVQSYLKDLTTEVRLIQKSALTLSGRSATIPVTVQNKLVQGVDNLVLRLKSSNPTRLKLDDGSVVAEQPIKIDGGHSQSVKFAADANANGPVQVTAQLYTEDGKLYGGPMTFTVKASEITPTVMLVIAGGVLLLVLAGVRMYTQRKRAAAREAAAAGNAGDETHERAVPDASEQPSDPTPDTAPESADPSGAGEKVDR
ncbi:DUF6049 family protein [Streptomyces sp. I6]|uniref:DUF6049 family protein n=1 Tax=Streptomyces sp. I6 TaxID=2483113 RepID=UPI001618BF78|nr:DUF6049 family protein [Streptomyces sp. I6]